MTKRILAGVAVAIALTTVAADTAGADPANRNAFGPIAVDCGVAGSFDVVAHGNGQFAAAQVLGSTKVLVPLAFKNESFTYTDFDGLVYPPELSPPTTKGSGKQAGVWCSYTFDIDTGNGLENLSGSGDVFAKITSGK